LHFFRDNGYTNESAFIEHLFPRKSELCDGRLIRKVPGTVSPISVELAGAIIKELVYQCAFGRPNASHHAGEALALVWLCLVASRIRLPRTLKSVHDINVSAIIGNEKYSELYVPSFFGACAVRISKQLAQFLQVVAEINSKEPRTTILQTPLCDLRKPLNKVLKNLEIPSELGEITFLTFLSSPHHFGKDIRSSLIR